MPIHTRLRWLAAAVAVGVGVWSVGTMTGRDAGEAQASTSRAPGGLPEWSLAVEEAAPESTAPRHVLRLPITVTGYSSTADQTDSNPFETASGAQVRPGIIALSRDLLREYTPGAPFSFGDQVEIEGVGVFQVEDTMSRRFRKRADIWFTNRSAAIEWGRQRHTLALLANQGGAEDALRADGLPADFETAPAD